MAALLIGSDADAGLADSLGFGTDESGLLLSSPIATAAGAAVIVRQASMTAQVGPTPYYPGGSLSQLFNRGGLLGGFAAGFLGAGLLGLLFGRGLAGGLGSVASYLGLLFQLALWVMLGRLIWTRWRSGDASTAAGLSPRELADPYLRSRDDLHGRFIRSAGPDETLDANHKPGEDHSEAADTRGKRK